MADIYGAVPTFTQGQVLSASAHLNALQAYVQALRDDFSGVAMPFSSEYKTRICTFALRHKYDYLSYSYEILSGSLAAKIQISIAGVWTDVPGSEHTGAGTYLGVDVDISSLGLTVDEFYEVKVEIGYETWAQGRVTVHYLAETQADFSGFATLPDFTDGMTPTAAQWQALSTRAAALGALIATPQPTGQATYEQYVWPTAYYRMVRGTFNHRGRYLAYRFYGFRSDNRDEDDEHWTDNSIEINGVSVLRRRVGGGNAPGSAAPGEDYAFVDAREYEWEGVLDLNTYPGTLALGDFYRWTYRMTSVGGGTGGGEGLGGSNANAGLLYLYEIPDETAATSGWTNFVSWAHGDFVQGDSLSPQVQTLVDNLNLLSASTQYANYATVMDRGTGPGYGLYGIRRWRWLHYRTDPQDNRSHADDDDPYDPMPPAGTRTIDAEPVLIYTYKGDEKRVSLSDAYYDWLALDLDSAEGLVPGTPYKLENVRYALEDTYA